MPLIQKSELNLENVTEEKGHRKNRSQGNR